VSDERSTWRVRKTHEGRFADVIRNAFAKQAILGDQIYVGPVYSHAGRVAQCNILGGRSTYFWRRFEAQFNDQLERTPANHRQLFELACMRLVDLKSDLETGDASVASILKKVTRESHVRNYIGGWLRDRARTRYTIPQEEEFADATRPDLRFHGTTFDGPVPMELKLADNWTGPHLFERLENQLCRDYLRDSRSNRGIFGLVYRGKTKRWALPNSSTRVNFDGLVRALEEHWTRLSTRLPNVEEVRVIGIDLTKRNSKPVLE
jgi:hypothetical protein